MKLHRVIFWLKRSKFKNIKLILFTLIPFTFFLLLLNVFLSTRVIAPKDLAKLREIDNKFLEENEINASKHPYSFNDEPIRPKKKNEIRFIMMGDSFVFGDGVPLESTWTRFFERKIKEVDSNIDILHWGRRGWSTLNQIEFLKSNFENKSNIENADVFILCFVMNDPDLYRFQVKTLDLHDYFLGKALLYFTPSLFSILNQNIDEFLNIIPFSHYGYAKWINGLYKSENFEEFKKVFLELKGFVEDRKCAFFVYLTPDSFDSDFYVPYIDLVVSFLELNNVDHYNPYPNLKKALMKFPVEKLIASPINMHPSPLVNNSYADELLKYLNRDLVFEKYLFKNVKKSDNG